MAKLDINIEFKKVNISSASFEYIVKPALMLFALLLLTTVVINLSSSRIKSQKVKIAKAKKQEEVLSEKYQLLNQVESNVASLVDYTTLALPSENPVLIFISQLKRVSEDNLVTLTNLSGGSVSKDKSGLSRVGITFDVEGEYFSVMNFLDELESEIAPIAKVQTAKVSQLGGAARSEATVMVFFLEFPTKLPALTEAIKGLDSQDAELLNEISTLTPPLFTEVEPQPGGLRVNPFEY